MSPFRVSVLALAAGLGSAAAQAAICVHPMGNVELAPIGDLNGSGAVNVADAICGLLAVLAVQGGEPAPACLAAGLALVGGDANCDGEQTVEDVVLIASLALGAGPGALDTTGDGCPDACQGCAVEGGSSCLVGGTCVAEGGEDPTEACRECDPATDPAGWTPLPAGAPCGEGLTCQSGSCGLALPAAPLIVSVAPVSGGFDVELSVGDGGGAPVFFTVYAAPGGHTTSGPGTSLSMTGLSPGVAYTLTATATNATGEGPPSDPYGPVQPWLPASCSEAIADDPFAASGVFTIQPDGATPTQVYCDMSDGDGWTLVAKIQAGPSSAFTYGSALWTTSGTLAPTDFDLTQGEAKFAAFDSVRMSRLRLLDPATGRQIIAAQTGASLSEVIASIPPPGLDPGGAGLGTVPQDPPGTPATVLRYDAGSLSFVSSHNPLSICNSSLASAPWSATHGIGFNNGGAYNSAGSTTATGFARFGTWTSGSNAHIWSQTADCGFGIGVTSTGHGGQVQSGTTMGAFTTVWVRATAGSSALDAAPSCQHILDEGGSMGDGVYWLDPSGSDPFLAYCDMTTDDGGWTLYALGSSLYGAIEQPAITDPGAAAPRTLQQDRAEALAAASTGLFRMSNASRTQSFFIQDDAPLYFSGSQGGFARGHIWSTDALQLACATSYAEVAAASMTTTSTFEVDCEPEAAGVHTCGITAGWILFHNGGTFDYDGQHPCSLGAGQSTGLDYRWLR